MRLLTCGVDRYTRSFLHYQHFLLSEAMDGDDALSILRLDASRDKELWGFDILIADIERSDTGTLFPYRIRNCGSEVGIIMIGRHGGRDTAFSKAKVLENGGNYCLMPFTNPNELRAPIFACMRRAIASNGDSVSAGPITIDLKQKTAAVYGVSMKLTPHEFIVLSLLVSRNGRVTTKEMLISHLPVRDIGVERKEHRLVEVHICRLRRKLDEAFEESGDYIVTVSKRGYFCADKPHPGKHARLRKRRLQTRSLNRAH